MPVTAPARSSARSTRRQAFLTADTTPDATLVGLAARGDERAFEILFQRHRTDVLAYATRMLRDHGRAEDVVQDVFVSAMRAIMDADRASQPVHVRAWLREIARRACIDQWRGTTRRGEVSLDAPDRLRAADAHRLADDDSLARATDGREAVATLRLAFDDLPELQHAVLVQRELEGRSIAEIAARLETTPTIVEGQLARGRRALGQAYKELESGQRCVSVQALCDASVTDRIGVRDRHRVGRHVQGCDGCRRYARAAGVDARLIDRNLLQRASLLLPLPLLRRLPTEYAAGGEAAGGVLGAKVLVGAAVIAAGGGGVYARTVVAPTPSPAPAAPTTSPTDDAISRFGLQPGVGGTPVVRVPAVGGDAGTFPLTGLRLPGAAFGSSLTVRPRVAGSDAEVSGAASTAAPEAPSSSGSEGAAVVAPSPTDAIVLPTTPGTSPSRNGASSGAPARSVPLTPATPSRSSDDGPASSSDDTPGATGGVSTPSSGDVSSDDSPVTAGADVVAPTPEPAAPADPAPAEEPAPAPTPEPASTPDPVPEPVAPAPAALAASSTPSDSAGSTASSDASDEGAGVGD